MQSANPEHYPHLSRLRLPENAIVFLQQSVWNDLEEQEEQLCQKWKCKRLTTAVLFEMSGMEQAGKIIRHRLSGRIVLFTQPEEDFLTDAEWGLSDLILVYNPTRRGVIEIPPLRCDKDAPWTFDQYILKIAKPNGPWGEFVSYMREFYARDERLPKFDSFDRLDDFLSWRFRYYCDHHSELVRVIWDRFVKWQRTRIKASQKSEGRGSDSIPVHQ